MSGEEILIVLILNFLLIPSGYCDRFTIGKYKLFFMSYLVLKHI